MQQFFLSCILLFLLPLPTIASSYKYEFDPVSGIVLSGVSNYGSNHLDVGVDFHANFLFYSISAEAFYNLEANKIEGSGFIGLFSPFGQLIELQYGYGSHGHLFRIRNNISLKKKKEEGLNFFEKLCYSKRDGKKRRSDIILSTYVDMGQSFRVGIGIGILLY